MNTEILDLWDRIRLLEHLPKGGIVAEVGVLRGTFSQLIYDIVQPDELHLIDRWQRIWCDGEEQDGDKIYQGVLDKFADKPNVFIHKMNSVDAAHKFEDEFFDWVYLDAGHLYPAIKADIDVYKHKIKKWLIGHDFQSSDIFGTSVVRAVIEAIQNDGMRMIALTAHDDIPFTDKEEEAFPWGANPISWVLEKNHSTTLTRLDSAV